MTTADSPHSEMVLQKLAQTAGLPELRKMLSEKERTLELLDERIGFTQIAIRVFKKEIESRSGK